MERLAHLRAEIEVHQRALDKQTIELLKADAGSATEEALRRAGRELEGKLRGLKDALAELEDRSIPGVTDDDMATIERFAGQIQAGLSAANLDDRHQIYKLLRLRGTVNEDPEHGLQLRRKRFAIDWSAILDLSHDSTRFTTRPGT